MGGVFSGATVPWRCGARKEEKDGICRKSFLLRERIDKNVTERGRCGS